MIITRVHGALIFLAFALLPCEGHTRRPRKPKYSRRLPQGSPTKISTNRVLRKNGFVGEGVPNGTGNGKRNQQAFKDSSSNINTNKKGKNNNKGGAAESPEGVSGEADTVQQQPVEYFDGEVFWTFPDAQADSTAVPTVAPSQSPTKVSDSQQRQQAGQNLEGPGCRFENIDGSVTTFSEGQSMGTFSTLNLCDNSAPSSFPGYCVSTAPNQTVYPYCFFRDSFNQNICGRSGDAIALLHPNRTMIHCSCQVFVTPFGETYDIKVTSNCDMIDLTTAPPTPAPTTNVLVTAPPTTFAPTSSPPTTAMPTEPAPLTVSPIMSPAPTSAMPVTPMPTSSAPITPWPTSSAPITSWPTSTAPVAASPTTEAPSTASPTSAAPATAIPTTAAPSENNNQDELDYSNVVATYQPGNLTTYQAGLWLSQGLSARILARAGQPVPYQNSLFGSQSEEAFHPWPDGAAVFNDNRPGNSGGWIYVSNSEEKNGGVGALTFNAKGEVIHYRQILFGTKYNCNGGKTPWGSWITAEEDFDKYQGRLWQVDPYGVRQPEPLTLGAEGGAFEAFAYDIRNLTQPRFFASEDRVSGCLRRWTPTNPVWGMDPWPMLHGSGTTEYLILQPDFAAGGNRGTFSWTTDEKAARSNAQQYYPYTEGIEVRDNTLYFVIKSHYKLFSLNLDEMTYSFVSTRGGLFDGEPDQIKSILQDDGTTRIYFSEDWGDVSGIHSRDESGNFATILEGPQYTPETTGIDFSPSGHRLYFAFQESGVLFEVTRDDGLPFHAKTVNLKPFHRDNPAKYRRQ